MRTCVGCRGRERKAELIRLVVVDTQVTVDIGQRLPGRGAYLHRQRGCAESAVRRRALARALPSGSAPQGPELSRLVASVDNPA